MNFAELDDLIAWEIADKAIPSIAYAVFDRAAMLACRDLTASGVRSGDAALFRIGSITKTFTALMAMRLAERGGLSLDADIAEAVPDFRPHDPSHGEPITLRRLLGHRSGLTREARDGGYLDDRLVGLHETVDGLSRSTLKAPSDGSAYFYSNAGFAVIGRAIEIASGDSFADHLAVTLLDPLGLSDTAIRLTDAARDRLAPAMMWNAAGDYPAPVLDLGSPSAGNLHSSLDDVARYGRALLRGGEGIVRPETLSAMWSPPEPGARYGLGFSVDQLDGRLCVGHGGAVYGYSSMLLLLPEAGLGACVIATLDFAGELAMRLCRRALRMALHARDQGPAVEPARRLPPADDDLARRLAGTYLADDGRRLGLGAMAGRLHLIDREVPLELRPDVPGTLAVDGRLHGEGTAFPDPVLRLHEDGSLGWRGTVWRRSDAPVPPPPADLAQHLGDYAPAFMPTRLFWSGTGLVCLMENLDPHACEPLGGGRFRLSGGMYDREILKLGHTDAAGRPAIVVGEAVLSRLP